MTDILNKTIVLVLNRNWQAIHARTPQEAFCMMATNVATALDIAPTTKTARLRIRGSRFAGRTINARLSYVHVADAEGDCGDSLVPSDLSSCGARLDALCFPCFQRFRKL